ncbi:MAG: hypothetical protein RLZZ241_2112 [Bacteroidota bacterium]
MTYSRENLEFLLFDVLNVSELTGLPYFAQHQADSLRMALDAGHELAQRIQEAHVIASDRNPPEIQGDRVVVHPSIHEFVKNFAEAGFIGATLPEDLGGFQLPKTIIAAVDFILCTRSNSYIMYTDLAKGVANMLATFGTPKQQQQYLPQLQSGALLGTMCLTEPDAGSALGNITTKATPLPNGAYAISGQKIFISAGSHNITENILHLVLARIAGAPQGTRGISLFLVPAVRANGEDNDVQAIGLYHKMGQKATPALHLGFGSQNRCEGYLLGTANQGLAHMFQMMDGARLSVGAMGAGMASAAYYYALDYARVRKQGKSLGKMEQNVPIVQHPDVQRMLLTQKAFVEGMLGFILQCHLYQDLQKHSKSEAETDKYTRLLNLLTPVAKTHGAEQGVLSVHLALQVFGGYGYTDDFPIEKLARDVRILPIYEGTSGIHALGVLGRQILKDGGISYTLWETEVLAVVQEGLGLTALAQHATRLQQEMTHFREVTQYFMDLSKHAPPETYLGNANSYLESLGILALAWQWLKQGIAAITRQKTLGNAVFVQSKLQTLGFYYSHEVPRLSSLRETLLHIPKDSENRLDSDILI